MKTLAIFGAGGHGKVVADTALICGWEVIHFFDDNWPNKTKNSHWDVKGTFNDMLKNVSTYDGFFVALGNNELRVEKNEELVAYGAKAVNIIHPKSIVSNNVEMNSGIFIGAGAIVNVDASLGMGVIINTGSIIEHDCHISNGAHIAPGASLAGNVKVGKNSWIGINSSVRQGITIHDNCVVGAGAVVVKDVESNLIVIGNPAKSMKGN